MYALLLAGQVITLVIMAAVSFWGWKRIDPETRIRSRDITHDSTMRSKTTALVWAPAFGLIVLLGTLAVGDDMIAALGLGVLVFFLLAHWTQIKRAAS